MKYFKIDYTTDLKVIGDFPQIQTFIKGYDSNRDNSCSRIGRYISEIPTIPFDFDGLELAKSAKLTDYISASYLSILSGLLITKVLYDFLGKLRVVNYLRYPVKIYSGGELITDEYTWLHYSRSYPEFIDFEKSEFYLDHPEVNYKKLSLKTYESFLEEKAHSNYIIESKRLVLKKGLASQLDVIRLGVIKGASYVTEVVKDEMCDRGFTGIVYEQAEYLISK
jgi:hypothetical protein